MINIDPTSAFASGWFRHVYLHPDNADLCIKVDRPNRTDTPTTKEIRFLERPVIARRLAKGAPFAPYHGHVETNLGIGAVFSIIRDGDGTVSETLFAKLKRGLTPDEQTRYAPALDQFKRRFRETAIVCRDLRAWNICVRETPDTPPEMILIDGFGHRYGLPLVDYIPALAQRKIDTHFEKFGFSDLETMARMYTGPDRTMRR